MSGDSLDGALNRAERTENERYGAGARHPLRIAYFVTVCRQDFFEALLRFILSEFSDMHLARAASG